MMCMHLKMKLLALCTGERVGCVSILCSNEEECDIVESQMRMVIRPMYSNPPISGARIATNLLTNLEYKKQW